MKFAMNGPRYWNKISVDIQFDPWFSIGVQQMMNICIIRKYFTGLKL